VSHPRLKHPTTPHGVIFGNNPRIPDTGPIVHPEDGRRIAAHAYRLACERAGRSPDTSVLNGFLASVIRRGSMP
jgi:hypothetical protein